MVSHLSSILSVADQSVNITAEDERHLQEPCTSVGEQRTYASYDKISVPHSRGESQISRICS